MNKVSKLFPPGLSNATIRLIGPSCQADHHMGCEGCVPGQFLLAHMFGEIRRRVIEGVHACKPENRHSHFFKKEVITVRPGRNAPLIDPEMPLMGKQVYRLICK